MTKSPRTSRPLSRPVVATGIAATVLIAAGAFVLSFAALTDLAVMAGISPALAWIWPVIVDGLIVAATVSIVALAGHDRRTMAYPWVLLLGGAVVSTAANAVHAILAADGAGVPAWVSAVVASMPPVVLLAVTHLSVVLVQKAGTKPAARKVRGARSAAKAPKAEAAPAPAWLPEPPAPKPAAQVLQLVEKEQSEDRDVA